MPSFVQVDLDSVRATADVEAWSGDQISRIDAGGSLSAAASGMAGLRSAEGCQVAGASFDAVVAQASGELSEHSERLLRAVRDYEEQDAASAHRLTKTVELK